MVNLIIQSKNDISKQRFITILWKINFYTRAENFTFKSNMELFITYITLNDCFFFCTTNICLTKKGYSLLFRVTIILQISLRNYRYPSQPGITQSTCHTVWHVIHPLTELTHVFQYLEQLRVWSSRVIQSLICIFDFFLYQ